MSRNGQSRTGAAELRQQRPIAVVGLDYKAGAATGRHAHPVGQLVHAASGVMRVITDRGAWVVPPRRAVWIPTFVLHDVRMVTAVAMRTVYVVDSMLRDPPVEPRVVEVSPLLREVILEAMRLPRPYPLGGAEERLFQVLIDHISFRDVIPLHLPSPTDDALRFIADALERDPADESTLSDFALALDVSARTLARRFRSETKLTFGAWRAQLRLMRSLELLAEKQSVTDVAMTLGYESTSAFISTFRRHLGTTPAKYFDGS